MSVPAAVESALGDEEVAAEVPLGSEDALYVTPTRTIIYRGEGLLSDEAVEEYTHDADRIVVKSGRRKARITLQDDIEGERSFTVPPKHLDDALHPVLAGVLNAAGVTEPGETVKRTFRFSELTVIVTSRRLVKHIGEAVWDTDYEEYHFEDATGLDFEEGSVATQVVLEVDGRRERIKAPTDQAPEFRAELEEVLFDFYDVDSLEAFERATSPGRDQEEPETAEPADQEGDISFESGLSPLDTGSPGDSAEPDHVGQGDTGTETSSEDPLSAAGDRGADPAGPAADADRGEADLSQEATSPTGEEVEAGAGPAADLADEAAASPGTDPGGEDPSRDTSGDPGADEGDRSPASDRRRAATGDPETVSNEELAERLDELTEAVKHQNELLETHAHTIERLIEELKRMQ